MCLRSFLPCLSAKVSTSHLPSLALLAGRRERTVQTPTCHWHLILGNVKQSLIHTAPKKKWIKNYFWNKIGFSVPTLKRENIVSSSCRGTLCPDSHVVSVHLASTLTEEVGEVRSVTRQTRVLISVLLLLSSSVETHHDDLRLQLPPLTTHTVFTDNV